MKRWLPFLAAGMLAAGAVAFACQAVRRDARRPAPTSLPEKIVTARGEMRVEDEYLPGVVDCEMAHFTTSAPALEAQAIAARTYLLRYLVDRGTAVEIPIGPQFQCWRPPVHDGSARAAKRTAGLVLRTSDTGDPLTGNYAAGASGLDDACAPPPPSAFGYDGDSWDVVRRAWVVRSQRQPGPAWTEIFVTDNAGKRGAEVGFSVLGPRVAWNRGALGQNVAICLAERRGFSREEILQRFYGEDVVIGP